MPALSDQGALTLARKLSTSWPRLAEWRASSWAALSTWAADLAEDVGHGLRDPHRLDGGIEGQEVGLTRDGVDDLDPVRNSSGTCTGSSPRHEPRTRPSTVIVPFRISISGMLVSFP